MKLLVIGLGRGGGRIADEFVRLNKKARARRGGHLGGDLHVGGAGLTLPGGPRRALRSRQGVAGLAG